MADLEQTAVLTFEVDETDAVTSIKTLRDANSQLRRERDNVNVATAEGQAIVQKLNKTIDDNNKKIKDNSSALEKQRQNVGNYTNSIKDAANELNIMGVNVGAVTTKLTSFINPATAAVGVLSALGAAYANSTTGAKDLEFAQNQLSSAFRLASNELGDFISSSEDGEGVVTIITNAILFKLNPSLAATSRALTLLQQQFEDLSRNERIARGDVNALLEENAEKITKIQDSQTSYNDKIHEVGEILGNINAAQDKLTAGSERLVKNGTLLTKEELAVAGVLTQQLQVKQRLLDADEKNEKLIDERNILIQQISAEDRKFSKQREAILRLESNIKDQYKAQAKAQSDAKAIQDEADRNARRGNISAGGTGVTTQDARVNTAQAISNIIIQVEKNAEITRNKTAEEGAAYRKAVSDAELQQALYYSEALVNLASIGGEQNKFYKASASAQTIISTYASATKSYEALANIPYVGPALGAAAAAAAITAGLANLAKINDVQFAEGGFTGKGGKYEPAGIVHRGEYVVPQHIVKNPSYAGHIGALESARVGYADGGFVANTNGLQAQQNMLMMNMIKRLPPPEVSVKQITKVQNQITVKENISRI